MVVRSERYLDLRTVVQMVWNSVDNLVALSARHWVDSMENHSADRKAGHWDFQKVDQTVDLWGFQLAERRAYLMDE
jgi:hypothetical protein